MQIMRNFLHCLSNLLGPFPPDRIVRKEQNFLLLEDKLVEGMRQKTKEIIVPSGKFRLVETATISFDAAPSSLIGL